MQTVNDVYKMQIRGPSLCKAFLAAQLFLGIYWLKRLFLSIGLFKSSCATSSGAVLEQAAPELAVPKQRTVN
jgi:hypothetical protein